MISSLYLSPGFFRARLEVFPGLIAGGLKLQEFRFRFILFVLQGVDGFVVFDLRIGLGIVRLGPEQSDLRAPFLQLRFELFLVCFSCILRNNLPD